MKFHSGYFTRLVSARNGGLIGGIFINCAGIAARIRDLRQQHAVDAGATQRAQRGRGSIPLDQRSIGFFRQNGALNIRIVVTVEAEQVQCAL